MRLSDPINVTCLVKDDEQYVLMYDDAHVTAAMQQVARWASRDDLSLSWYDAAKLAHRIRAGVDHDVQA